MTENRYDDETLSAIIDGEAEPEIVASVEADPVARQRLAAMRDGIEIVQAPVPEATAERRSQSIAAAMAAATPASPEVASLSAQRHKSDEQNREESKNRGFPTGWLVAAAAAVIVFVLAIPTLFNTGAVDTATDAAGDEAADAAGVVDDAADAVTGDDDDAAEDDDGDDAAAAVGSDDSGDEEVVEEVAEEEAADDAADADAAAEAADAVADADDSEPAAEPAAAPDFVDLDIEVVTSFEELDELIDSSAVAPELTGEDILAFEPSLARSGEVLDEVLATEVNPACLNPPDGIANPTPYSVVVLDPFAGGPTLVIVEFADDGMTRLFDAETCELLR